MIIYSGTVYNAIVWMCRRTADICDDLKNKGYEKRAEAESGDWRKIRL